MKRKTQPGGATTWTLCDKVGPWARWVRVTAKPGLTSVALVAYTERDACGGKLSGRGIVMLSLEEAKALSACISEAIALSEAT